MCLNISEGIRPPSLTPPPPLYPHLSLWEVNVGEWKQEAQATVWLKRTAGIFSTGPAVPRPLFPPGPPGGYYCPLLWRTPRGNEVKLRKGPVNPDSFYIGSVCQSWHFKDINTRALLCDLYTTPTWDKGSHTMQPYNQNQNWSINHLFYNSSECGSFRRGNFSFMIAVSHLYIFVCYE